MLIDANAHIGHWPFRHREYNTCESLLGRMDTFGVDKAIISHLSACLYKNPQTANSALMEEIDSDERFRQRFIPVGVINPIYGGWEDDLRVCSEEFGMRGIKIYPKYHGYAIGDPVCVELVRMARDRNLVVAIPLRVVDRRPSSWLDIMEEFTLTDLLPIIRAVPDAKYLIQNVANRKVLAEEDIVLLRSANVVIDTSGRRIDILGTLIKTLGEDVFCFGSHAPILDYCTGLLRIESLTVGEASEPLKNKLRSGNILQLLGM